MGCLTKKDEDKVINDHSAFRLHMVSGLYYIFISGIEGLMLYTAIKEFSKWSPKSSKCMSLSSVLQTKNHLNLCVSIYNP